MLNKRIIIILSVFLLVAGLTPLSAGGKKEDAAQEETPVQAEQPAATEEAADTDQGTAISIDSQGAVAVVNGYRIMEAELQRQLDQLAMSYMSQGYSITEEQKAEMRGQIWTI